MVALRLIPCLDVANGRVVKGVNFVNLRDSGDPVELACKYSEAGADELVFLDIRASVENRKTLVDLVSRTAKSVKIPFTVGGGINSINSINDLLRAGADKVSLNSSAVKNPDIISKSSANFGTQCIVIAIDARKKINKSNEWEVYVKGGRENTGLDVISWAKKVEELGAGEILLTSMDGDGTQNGYDLLLTQTVANAVNIPVIASGGAGSVEDIYDVFTKGKAVKNPDIISKSSANFGTQCIVIAIDARKKINKSNEWEVYVKGGRENTGLDVISWAKKVEELGAGEILLTSMDGDGTQNGYDLLLTQTVANAVNIPVIASGGAGSVEDIYDVFTKGKASAALLASLLHDKKLTIDEIKSFLIEKKLPMRPN